MIAWDEALERDSDYLSQFPTALRSLKSNLATGLSQSMEWPGSGGGSLASAGQMKLGTFRAFLALQSAFSIGSPGTTGRLYVTSGNVVLGSGRLFATGSAATIFLGGNRVMESATAVIAPHRWVLSAGTAAGGAVSYGTVYAGIPTVAVSVETSVASTVWPCLSSVTQGGFTYDLGPGAIVDDTTTLGWESVGTVVFG